MQTEDEQNADSDSTSLPNIAFIKNSSVAPASILTMQRGHTLSATHLMIITLPFRSSPIVPLGQLHHADVVRHPDRRGARSTRIIHLFV